MENKTMTQVVCDETVNEKLDDLNINYETMMSGDFDPNQLLEILGVVDHETEEANAACTSGYTNITPIKEEDEYFEDVVEEAASQRNPEEDAIYEAAKEKAAADHEFDPNFIGKAQVVNDPITGINTIRPIPEDGESFDDLRKYFDDLEFQGIKGSEVEEYQWENDPMTEEERLKMAEQKFLEATTEEYELPDIEGMGLMKTILRVRNGEKFNIYESLPPNVQKEVDNLLKESGRPLTFSTREEVAKFIIDGMISDINLEKEFIDFQENLSKELNIPEITEFYSEAIKTQMEDELLKIADEVEKEDPDKAESLRRVSQAYTDSYTYTRILDGLENNSKIRNRITKDFDKYKRFCEDINRKMKDSQFIIKDTFLMAEVLAGKLDPKYTERDIANFVIAFAKTCDKLSADRIEDCAYIYYTIRNVTDLAFFDQAGTEFSKQIINNIETTIDRIKEVEQRYLDMKAERPAKKSKKSKK